MSASINWQVARKCVIGVLIALFLAGLVSQIYIHLSYWSNMPRTPDRVAGRVFHIYVNHHTLVCVTRRELDRAKFVFGPVSYATIGAGILLAFVKVYWTEPAGLTVSSSDGPV